MEQRSLLKQLFIFGSHCQYKDMCQVRNTFDKYIPASCGPLAPSADVAVSEGAGTVAMTGATESILKISRRHVFK